MNICSLFLLLALQNILTINVRPFASAKKQGVGGLFVFNCHFEFSSESAFKPLLYFISLNIVSGYYFCIFLFFSTLYQEILLKKINRFPKQRSGLLYRLNLFSTKDCQKILLLLTILRLRFRQGQHRVLCCGLMKRI